MLCCVGLIGGLSVGQALGGPWTVIAPAAGFGIGLIGDMKLMRHMHGRPRQQSDDTQERTSDRAACAVHALLQKRPKQQPEAVQKRGAERDASAAHALDVPAPSDQGDEQRVLRA